MRVVVHLSDLHFGTVDEAILQPLQRSIESEQPHLIVVSGDLTQRARPSQFREARAFLDRLPGAKLAVPGNHDVPLYNLVQRFVQPFGPYRKNFSGETQPEYVDEEIAAIGVNTARSAVFKGGRINRAQIERVRARLCSLDRHVTRMVVTHHPFDLPAHYPRRNLVGRAALAMAGLARCGADLLLAGHLHASHAGDTAARYRIPGFAALVVQAGTAASTRGRGEANAFNVLRIERDSVAIEAHVWDGNAFTPGKAAQFARTAQGWRRSDGNLN